MLKLTKPEHAGFHLLVVENGAMVIIECVVIAQKCFVINYREMISMGPVLNTAVVGKEFVTSLQDRCIKNVCFKRIVNSFRQYCI